MNTFKKIIKWVVCIFFIIFLVGLFGSQCSRHKSETLVEQAWTNGDIKLGMTYNEIIQIAGKPEEIGKVNGKTINNGCPAT